MKKSKQASPRPTRAGIYPAETWEKSNPGYTKLPPTEHKNGWVTIDVGGWYDYQRELDRKAGR